MPPKTDKFAVFSEELHGIQAEYFKQLKELLLLLHKQQMESINTLLTAVTSGSAVPCPNAASTKPLLSMANVSLAITKAIANRDSIDDKSTRAVICQYPELETDELTTAHDKSVVDHLVATSGSLALADSLTRGKISCHRHPPQRKLDKEGKPAYTRVLKIQFECKSDRDVFITHVRRNKGPSLGQHPHSYIRRDLTYDELIADRAARRQCGQLNEKAGQLQWVVRDVPVKLQTPRELPERNRLVIEEKKKKQQAKADPKPRLLSVPIKKRKNNGTTPTPLIKKAPIAPSSPQPGDEADMDDSDASTIA